MHACVLNVGFTFAGVTKKRAEWNWRIRVAVTSMRAQTLVQIEQQQENQRVTTARRYVKLVSRSVRRRHPGNCKSEPCKIRHQWAAPNTTVHQAGATYGRSACEHGNQTSCVLFLLCCAFSSSFRGDDVTQNVSRARGVTMTRGYLAAGEERG